MVLRDDDPATTRSKSTANSDVIEAHVIDIVAGMRVVFAVDFDSDDPRFAGTMTMTWEVNAVDGGSRVDVTAEGVPDAISRADHAAGLNSTLANLANYLRR